MPNNPISHEVATEISGQRMLGTAVATSWLCRALANCLFRAYARSYLLSSLRDYLNPDVQRSGVEAFVFPCAPRCRNFQFFVANVPRPKTAFKANATVWREAKS